MTPWLSCSSDSENIFSMAGYNVLCVLDMSWFFIRTTLYRDQECIHVLIYKYARVPRMYDTFVNSGSYLPLVR